MACRNPVLAAEPRPHPRGPAGRHRRSCSPPSSPGSRSGKLAERASTHIKADDLHDLRPVFHYRQPYRSFRSLLEHLATLTRNQVRFAGTRTTVPMLTEPTSAQREAFRLIGVPIPLTLK